MTAAMRCGGVETFIVRLAKYLAQAGLDVEVVTTDEPGEWFDILSRNGLKGLNIGPRSQTRLGRAFEVGRWLARRRYDVVLLNHARYAQASMSLLGKDVIVVPIIHNDYDDVYRVACANRRAWNVAVAVSPGVRQVAQSRAPGRPIVNICNGVELPREEAWRTRTGMRTTVRLVFAGRVAQFQKRADLLPDILRACLNLGVDAVLTVLGTGPDLGSIQNKVEQYALTSRVDFRGAVPPAEVGSTLLDSHVLLMPSSFEGLPITLLEAMACGCVPVASRLPGVTDSVVEDGQSGTLVEPGNVSDFAAAVAGISRDPGQWARMSRMAHERVSHSFSLQTMGRQYVELIQDSLRGKFPVPWPRSYQLPVDVSLFPLREGLPLRLRVAARNLRTLMAPAFTALGSLRRE